MVKEKPNSIRIYDSEGYRRRAACICVKSDLEDEVSLTEGTVHWHLFLFFLHFITTYIQIYLQAYYCSICYVHAIYK